MPDLAKLHCMEQDERHALHTGYPPDRLGWSQSTLRAANRDLPHLRIYAQAHVGPPNRIAFVVVHGVGEDRDRRRRVRAEASDLLERLGYAVELEPERDVYDVAPPRPVSAHDEL
ncbi:hypothetical protein KUV28_02545 [Ferrimonas balearica]|nr:hypothetical protein [Ferrimonas balearica]